jgi:hypothetical protein
MAKRFPSVRVARKSIETVVRFVGEVDALRADAVQDAAKVLPQAFHELRKLNGAILQHAEKEMSERGDTASLHDPMRFHRFKSSYDRGTALADRDSRLLMPYQVSVPVLYAAPADLRPCIPVQNDPTRTCAVFDQEKRGRIAYLSRLQRFESSCAAESRRWRISRSMVYP